MSLFCERVVLHVSGQLTGKSEPTSSDPSQQSHTLSWTRESETVSLRIPLLMQTNLIDTEDNEANIEQALVLGSSLPSAQSQNSSSIFVGDCSQLLPRPGKDMTGATVVKKRNKAQKWNILRHQAHIFIFVNCCSITRVLRDPAIRKTGAFLWVTCILKRHCTRGYDQVYVQY